MTPWLLSKFRVWPDGRTPYTRWHGKAISQETAEFGGHLHFKLNLKGKPWGEQPDARKSRNAGEALASMETGASRVRTA